MTIVRDTLARRVGFLGALTESIGRFVRGARFTVRSRRATRRLSYLGDAELDDIGLTRADVRLTDDPATFLSPLVRRGYADRFGRHPL